jgi:hypothetical protein
VSKLISQLVLEKIMYHGGDDGDGDGDGGLGLVRPACHHTNRACLRYMVTLHGTRHIFWRVTLSLLIKTFSAYSHKQGIPVATYACIGC